MIKQFKSNLINLAISFSLGAFCIFWIIKLQSIQVKQITEDTLDEESYVRQEKAEGLKLSFLKKMPSFGFDNLIADWTMLRFLQYFGDEKARNQTGYSLSPNFLEVIVDRDPFFSRAYLIISPASSMFAGYPERTVALMEKGLKHLSPDTPDAYYVWLYKGVDEILFLDDLEQAQNSYEMSAKWASIAGNEFIAKSASGTAEFLANKPDATQAQIGAWFQLYVNARDTATRQIAERNIESLGGELKVYPDGRVEAIPPQNS
ncbi:hypothetical protein [Myxosarcina sp. GI1]|uniref:hypothetical protein n=1 Tax=Myxosarcina sp. GI1 TaxID=1541065 RepID=UPI00056A858D|nr:hypothetical protein [Myxosarcina sp. GI1]